MNFLAHLYLSSEFDLVMVGNFIADFVKGSTAQKYPPNVQKGIRLHRDIDHFTDSHPIVKRSKSRLWERHRHYSAVIVDIYYDHFLASNWNQYSDTQLEEFSHKFYGEIKKYKTILPLGVVRMLHYMERDNWLYRYRTIEGIGHALSGLARRAQFPSQMGDAVSDLKDDYEAYALDFASFFPQLITYVAAWEEKSP